MYIGRKYIVGKYKNGQRTCNLCLTEKLFIIKCRDKHLLNSRSEIISKCRHKRKFLRDQKLFQNAVIKENFFLVKFN